MKFLVVLAAALTVAWCRDAITVDPGTSTGTGGVDVAGAGLQNLYCEAPNKECPGSNLESRFSPHIGDCLSRCNKNLKCLTVFYSSTRTCNLRSKRCSSGQLKSASGADYYRLKIGEQCPSDRPQYEFKGPFYSNTFCMMWGKACKGHNIYPKPQNIGPTYNECLKKCAKLKNCAMVDFYMQGGRPKCEPKDHLCSDDELVDSSTTQNFLRLLDGQTTCPNNRVPPSPTQPPVKPTQPPSCPANAYYNGQKCVCNSGFEMKGNKCVLPPPPSCPTNGHWNGQKCACNPGFVMQGNKCVLPPPPSCPTNGYWNGQQCICFSGFVMQGNKCVLPPPPSCPANGHWNGQRCVCNSGYVMQGNQCIQPSCQANANWNGNSCVCKSGFLMQGNTCVDNRPCIEREVSLSDAASTKQLSAGLLFYVQTCKKRYQMTSREVARQYCAKYGAELATPGHIKQAFNAGYYWCGCGWVTVGDARFPIVGRAKAHGCGKDNQINMCKPKFMGRWGGPGWDAWCFKRGHRG